MDEDRYNLREVVGDTPQLAAFYRCMDAGESLIGAEAPLQGSSAVATDQRNDPRRWLRQLWLTEPRPVLEAASPDGQWFASVRDGNIALRASADDRVIGLTTDGDPQFAWDVEAPRNKLLPGMQVAEHVLQPWSPAARHLFAIKYDRRDVPTLPVLHFLEREGEISFVKVQRAGGPLDIAHPHVIDVSSKRARRLNLGDTRDQFFTLVGWLPDGSEVLFTRHARDFKTVDVCAGNPVDGSVRIVISERAETFVAIQHEVIFSGDNHLTILPDRSGLIWRSARTGWNHLYLYALDGTLIRALTSGDYPVIDVMSVDMAQGWVYFTAHHDQRRPYDTHLCRVPLSGGDVHRLSHLDPSPAADDPGHVAAEEFTVLAADGETMLWGMMYKPANFDPKARYPVIDHLYAGPQVAMVQRHLAGGADTHKRLDRALAQLGYIVISLDARGTPERSKAFHDVVYRSWGRNEIPDHVAAIEQLAQRHAFIDRDRVGVWGHSWGGYFAIRALIQAPHVFRAAVSAAPATDPYDSILYEPYLDLPTRAKAAYDYARLAPAAATIEGRLMMVVGSRDPKNYLDVMEMVHRLIEARIDHELVVLPEAQHNFAGRDEEYFVSKLVRHFERHLRRRPPSAGASSTRAASTAAM